MTARKIRSKQFSFNKVFAYLKQYDFVQILAAASLLTIGVIFIYSTGRQAGTPLALNAWLKQLQWIFLGFCLWSFFAAGDYRLLKPLAGVFYGVCIILLIAVLVYGTKINGARRWLVISSLGIRLQPSEFAKLGTILLLSAVLTYQNIDINKFRYIALAGAVAALPFLLIVVEPDLGSALILLPLTVAIIFSAGLRWKYIIIASVLAGTVLTAEIANEVFKIHPLLKDYQKERIMTFMDPERDLKGRGYNQFQSKLAVGSGGMFGKGIGRGTQNTLGFLPQSVSNNDFIFSVIAEETGFAGCLALISAYIALIYSMLRTAFITNDRFGRYVAVGLAAVMFTHSFINMGMSAGLTPVTGLTLPFVSYGGSFIIFAMCGLGITQSIYRLREE
jgi:rod shape determining protein RodA